MTDHDNETSFKDVSCPHPDALSEALRVNGRVVYLTGKRGNGWPENLPLRSQAVLVRGYFGRYDLLKTYGQDGNG